MKKKRRTPEVEDVLAGRVVPKVEDLFDLVHEVNPAGIGGSAARERYETKSRLQSLLVTRFPDEVVAERETGNPGVVRLRHRSGLRDACHAVLSTLSAEARAVLHRQLDEAEAEAGAGEAPAKQPAVATRERSPRGRPALPSAGERRLTASELMARARSATAEFDYEEAERLLRQALEAGGGAEAARELLELLVEQLLMIDEALELARGLRPEEAADPGVRGLVALAHARAGDAVRATNLLRGLEGSAAVSAHAVLARLAITAGDLNGAAAHLRDGARSDPADPRFADLEREIEALRRKARGPAEEELDRLLASRDQATAETAARAVLERWPDSAKARRVLRQVEEALATGQVSPHARELLARAESLQRESDGVAAVERALSDLDRTDRKLLGELDAARGAGELPRARDLALALARSSAAPAPPS